MLDRKQGDRSIEDTPQSKGLTVATQKL